MEQIKIGDIVRVSEDAPKIYQKGSIFNYTERESIVLEMDGDAAKIGLDMEDSPIYSAPIIIPTKYLIKVNTEPKEPKTPRYKKGQKMVMPDGDVAIITEVNYNSEYPYSLLSLIDEDKRYWGWEEDKLRPYAESKEPTQKCESIPFEELCVVSQGTILESLNRLTHKVVMESQFDWQRYKADLAKEIVLKRINCASDQRPSAIGAYAVEVAKSVVENLKKRDE